MAESERKRRVQRVPYRENQHAVIDHSANVEEAAEAHLEVDRLRQALRRLPQRERQVVCWRHGIGGSRELSVRQIAKRLDVPRSTVWDIEQRALNLLRADYGLTEAATLEVAA